MEHIIIVVFICRENPRRSGIWLFPDCLRFRRLMKTRNRRSPRSSAMDGTGTNLENRKRFYFPDTSQISAMVGDHSRHSNLYRRVRRRWISLIRQSPKLLGSSPPITNKHAWRLSRIWDRRLGDYIYPIYRQNVAGWSAKRKIPFRLGFSLHVKTRLNVRVLG